ncbi:MAG: hypothetical protein MUO99_00045 [Dehalococcoidales bacterium]|nr:hypothetical protein [Dehalococcoidales bacterium]
MATARQAMVDALSSLSSGYTRPEVGYNTPDSARLEGWFDVNEYFSVLTHLSMQPGYTLDYVYHNIGGEDAHPFLYARKIGSKPFSTLDELAQTYNDSTNWYDSDHIYDYLTYVQTDGSEESFFQYIVLRIMGGQFYLWWHANYNDHTIICDHTGMEAILSEFTQQGAIVTMPSSVQEKARRLDLAPKVVINKDTVSVRVVIFTKWGGFIEETYTITRMFPHMIKDIRTMTLVNWDSNIMF